MGPGNPRVAVPRTIEAIQVVKVRCLHEAVAGTLSHRSYGLAPVLPNVRATLSENVHFVLVPPGTREMKKGSVRPGLTYT